MGKSYLSFSVSDKGTCYTTSEKTQALSFNHAQSMRAQDIDTLAITGVKKQVFHKP